QSRIAGLCLTVGNEPAWVLRSMTGCWHRWVRIAGHPLYTNYFRSFASILLLFAIFFALNANAQFQTVWKIGVEDDPLEGDYNPTGEFSQENFINDPRPGKV